MKRMVIPLAGLLAIVTSAPAADLPQLKFRDFYVRGFDFSETTIGLEGEIITIRGFMAPPLKPNADFFILTKMPMAVCPFCETEAEWPNDIVFVRMREEFDPLRFNTLIEVEGRLALGVDVDQETGFVSLMRLEDATYRVAR